MIADYFSYLQTQFENLDNRYRHNNVQLHRRPESVTDLMPAISKLFHNLLPDKPISAFTCDRIHKALRPKPPPDKLHHDVILCMKDFLTKENVMRASRNTPNIDLDGRRIQIYLDISPATLDRRRRMREVTSILKAARIRYRWAFPFKLMVPHNGTIYTV